MDSKTEQAIAVGISELVEEQKKTNYLLQVLCKVLLNTNRTDQWLDKIIKEAYYKEDNNEQ